MSQVEVLNDASPVSLTAGDARPSARPRIGEILVAPYEPYGEGCTGWIVETYHGDDVGFAIPAWEEMGMCHLEGPFPTRAAAQAAVDAT